MATRALTNADFATVVSAPGIVLIDFWAAWCGPCQRFAPVYEAASEKHPDVVFAKVDTDAQQDIALRFQVRSIPTIMAFRDGLPVFAQAGMLAPAALEAVLKQVRALDMEKVKSDLAAHKH
ncbi:MAG: thioredoxin [Polyangiales bacterium]